MTAPAILVVGASRGIGLEFVRQYRASGARVIATYRRPQDGERLLELGVSALALDVLDPTAIENFGERLAGETLQTAILNAGIYGPRSQGLEPPTIEEFDRVMHTNVLAPMRLLPLLAPRLAAGGRLAVLSSRMGSVSLMQSSSGWLYRASKAALNGALKTASVELGPKGIICLAFHPGWVRTDMGGSGADLGVANSVAGMRRVLAAAGDSHNGRFFSYNGEPLTW